MDKHRPGPLKQRNKVHKSGKKRSRNDPGGRMRTVSSSSMRSISSKGGSTVSKTVRKNQLTQLRNLKREEILNARRGLEVAPILIAVMHFGNKETECHEQLTAKVRNFAGDNCILNRFNHLHFLSSRTKFEIVFLDSDDLHRALDVTKIADILLILHSSDWRCYYTSDGAINDPERFHVLDAIYHHSMPPTIHAMMDLQDSEMKPNKKSDIEQFKKALTSMINKNYPGTMDFSKLRALNSDSDFSQFVHFCTNIKRKSNSYSCRRSQLLVENAEFIPSEDDIRRGKLIVEGFVRNSPFNANSLVYIPEFGEFQVDSVHGIAHSYSGKAHNPFNKSLSETFSQIADPEQRPNLDERINKVQTVFEEEMDDMEELDDIAIEEAHKKIRRKVPKGTSDYQSSWIVENDEEPNGDDNNQSEDEDDDDEMEEMNTEIEDGMNNKNNNKKSVRFAPVEDSPDEFDDDDNNGPKGGDENDIEMDVEENDENANYDDEMDLEEEASQLAKFREQNEYQMFPDEIDTPADKPARERFRKFKGLKSFRTSYWDPKENLPADYSRISQFENFNRTKRRLFKTSSIGADPGYYVRVQLSNVPAEVLDNPQKPLILFQLLAHEHKISVMNIVVKKVPTYTSAVKSKEELIFVVGCRRFRTRPIYSAHTTGDKHKYEKFLRDDVACVATIYAPITYPPAAVLVFKQLPNGREQLVATGSLLDCNPDRLIIKRFILSGHPFKINRKHAVVRYMFFNREDILWFRPIELRTKYGRRGHIQEPLGTHGHMKCIFDHQLGSQDTVMLCLYKRVFPKWTIEL